MNLDPSKITADSKSNFLYSFSFLPKKKNDAIKTIYAFCRYTDDIVDDTNSDLHTKEKKIREWNNEFQKSLIQGSTNNLLNAIKEIINKFKIPVELFTDFIKGMEQDLYTFRYDTYESLSKYCYRAASTVGLMSIEIFGYKNQNTKEFAKNLGMAFQLTNILRDIKPDAQNNRIYIPLEDLKRFNYSGEDLLNLQFNGNFIKLMQFECNRAKEYYKKADSNFDRKDGINLFPALIMQRIYFNILKKIEKANYNIFKKRFRISKLRKIYYALSIYLKYKIFK